VLLLPLNKKKFLKTTNIKKKCLIKILISIFSFEYNLKVRVQLIAKILNISIYTKFFFNESLIKIQLPSMNH